MDLFKASWAFFASTLRRKVSLRQALAMSFELRPFRNEFLNTWSLLALTYTSGVEGPVLFPDFAGMLLPVVVVVTLPAAAAAMLAHSSWFTRIFVGGTAVLPLERVP